MFRESEVQDAFAARARLVFPGYQYARFDGLVTADDGSNRPDFVLIEDQYRRWYVGEVEMVRHDLFGHVLRQIRTFLDGTYGEQHARAIAEHGRGFDEKRLQLMVDTVPPGVLVLADKMDESWRSAIHGEGAKLAVFEIFRRDRSADLIFRVNGDSLEVPDTLLTYCELDRSLRRLIRLRVPSSVNARDGEHIEIEYNGISSEWVYMVAEDKAWLNPVANLDLPRDTLFALSATSSNRLRLEAK